MSRFHAIRSKILGDPEQVGSERYFMTTTCFVTSFFLVLLCIQHILTHLKPEAVYIAGGSSIVIMGVFFLFRFGITLYIPKLILAIFGLLMMDLAWYFKYLSAGPTLFFVLILGALIIWAWHGRNLVFLMTLYFLNIAVLFVFDYTAPPQLFHYPDARLRSIDIFSSFLVYSVLMFILLNVVKKEYIKQREKAIRSDKLKSAFLSNMSHEIRTPMNAIVGFSELLEHEQDYVKRHIYTNIIRNSSGNLLKLINDIIDLSKIEAGDIHLSFSSFSVKDMFAELKEIYTLELIRNEKSDVSFFFDLPQGDVIITSDKERLKQVFFNLLSNAVKFTARGSVSYSCERKNGDVLFTISDTGTGIPEDDQKRIFDRFSKFNYEGMNNDGSGIGLSVVKKIIELLEGRIWLTSTTGQGTSFYISLPQKISS